MERGKGGLQDECEDTEKQWLAQPAPSESRGGRCGVEIARVNESGLFIGTRVRCLLVLEWLFIGIGTQYWCWYIVTTHSHLSTPRTLCILWTGGYQETRWPGKCMHSQKHVEIL